MGDPPEKWKHEEWACECVLTDTMDHTIPADWSGIDFLSVDTEGHDLEALKGWPWERVKPRVIVVEFGDRRQEIIDFLQPIGYTLWHETNQDLFLCCES
jgi:hypothetical protein